MWGHARRDGTTTTFPTLNRCDTPLEVRYYRHGGLLHYVPRETLREAPVTG